MFNMFNRKTKKAEEEANIKAETASVLSALASKQADLYAAIEKAMQKELKEQKS